VISTRPVVLFSVIAAIAIAGCGEEESEPAGDAPPDDADVRRLTSAERDLVLESEAAILGYCSSRAQALTDPSKRPTVAQQTRALEGVDALVELAAAKPSAELRSGSDVRLFVSDLAENLEGSNCDPAIIARLDAGLAQLESG